MARFDYLLGGDEGQQQKNRFDYLLPEPESIRSPQLSMQGLRELNDSISTRPTGWNHDPLPGENTNLSAPIANTLHTLSTPLRAFFNAPFNQRAGQTGAEIMTGARQEKPSTGSKGLDTAADLLGGVMGFGANPGGNIGASAFKFGEKAVAPILSKLPKVGQIAAPLVSGSVAYDVADKSLNGDPLSPKDMAIAAGSNAALGLLPYGVGKGLEATRTPRIKLPELKSNPLEDVQNAYRAPSLHDVRQKEYDEIFSRPVQQEARVMSRPENPSQYFTKTQSDLESAFPPRQFNQYKFSTGEQRALEALNDGVQTAQNYIGHYDLSAKYPSLETAYADIKANTGVDLPKLNADYQASIGQKATLGENRGLAKAAGVAPNLKPRETLKIELPKIEQQRIEPLKLEPRQWTNTEQIQARSGQFSPFELPKLEPRKIEMPKPLKPEIKLPDLNKPGEEGWVSLGDDLASSKSVEVDKLVANSDRWGDKMKPLLKRETMLRNFEDIMGEDAPEVKKTILDPIGADEAKRARWLNQERQEITDLGIKPKSKESELVQKYGEGQWVEVTKDGKQVTHEFTEADLVKAAPQNWEKIKKASEVLRGKYDSYLSQINQALERNGYDPIPKRKDYFTHFQEVSDFFEKFGIPTKDNALPTDINGLTSNFKPGKNFFANALRRVGNRTTYDAIQGIDRYIEGASRMIYHTDNIQRLRSFESALRDKWKGSDHLANFASELTEYTNNLAGKKSLTDRGAEDLVGRKVYGAVERVRKQVASNMVGANIGAALTNFIPITQSLATTNKTAFAKGMLDTISNLWRKDGFVDSSDFLTRRMGSDRLVMNLWDKAADKGFYIFKVVDNFVSQVVTRSKYQEGLQNGLSHKVAMEQADKWAAKILADRSLGGMPTLFNSKTMSGIITQFQLEVNNQLSFMTKDIPRNFSKTGAASAIAQMAIYGYLFNELYEKVAGRRPALDPIGLTYEAYKDYTSPNLETGKATANLTKNVANQLPFTSFMTGGRIPMQSGIPDLWSVVQGESTLKDETAKLPYLLFPTGAGQTKKTYEGMKAVNNGGVFNEDKTQLKYPVQKNFSNTLRGAMFGQYSFPEAQSYYDNNRRILSEDQTKQILNSSDPVKANEALQLRRRLETLQNQAKTVRKDKKLSDAEISEKIRVLEFQMAKVRQMQK